MSCFIKRHYQSLDLKVSYISVAQLQFTLCEQTCKVDKYFTLSEGIIDLQISQMRSEFVFVGSMGSSIPTFGSFSNTEPLLLLQSLHFRPERHDPNSVGSKHLLQLHTKFLFFAKKILDEKITADDDMSW